MLICTANLTSMNVPPQASTTDLKNQIHRINGNAFFG